MNRLPAILLAGIIAALAACALAPPSPAAARDLQVGFADDQFGSDLLTNTDASVRGEWFDNLADTNAGLARINVYWNQTAVAEPLDPTDPADPAYEWSVTDGAVVDARERGLEVLLTVLGGPRWAEAPGRPEEIRPGSWKPDAAKFGEFATALATRYSGDYSAAGIGTLPGIDYYEPWNEPNLPNYIAPQWDGREPVSPEIYRDLLNAFYTSVHEVNPQSVVVAAGTSPFGDQPGGKRMAPYYFWRQVFCLEDNLELDRKCANSTEPALMDRFSHHPINAVAGAGPTSPPPGPDDGVPSNFRDLTEIVRKAERVGTVEPPGKRFGWATEVWYESNPPEEKAVSLKKQAKFQQEVQYVLWKGGAETVIFLQLRDSPYDPADAALFTFQTGVYFLDGETKPSLRAVQFPFVADRKSNGEVVLWGKSPEKGELKITDKVSSGQVAKLEVDAGEVFETEVELSGKAEFEARVNDEKSFSWRFSGALSRPQLELGARSDPAGPCRLDRDPGEASWGQISRSTACLVGDLAAGIELVVDRGGRRQVSSGESAT